VRRLQRAFPAGVGERRGFYLLGLDFDGTLAPIVRRPGMAKLPPRNKALLVRLSKLKKARVAIVTGRALADIKAKVGLPGLIYVGNHGLEIEDLTGRVWVHPQARRCVGLMRRLAAELREALKPFPGAFVEDKGLTLSVHYRALPRYLSPRPIREIMGDLVAGERHRVRIKPGKKVWEVRPNLKWNKGYAMRRLLGSKIGQWHPVLVGDDVTDEEGFRSLGPDAITIRVGYKKDSNARFRLKSQRQTAPMLEYFLREWR
jgi:trehalose 6-phosphate phosphatase